MSTQAQRQVTDEARQRQRRSWVTALLGQRCPRCREGRIFKQRVTMNARCPACGLLFQREEGYFLGAMYFSYFLAVAILVPIFFVLAWLLPDWNPLLITLLCLVPYLPLMPAVFRYSRVLWIYFERFGAPTDVSAGAYEKLRMKRLGQAGRRARDKKRPVTTKRLASTPFS